MPPNLLLVIVDDLRADHLHLGSSAGPETPFLDDLASRAISYSRCFSPCGWTLPACASLLTGLLPTQHGLIHHDRRFGAPKIPALLGSGWATFGVGNNGNFVPDHISRETLDALGFERRPEVWKHFGWQEGFETYEWFHKQDKDGPFRVFAEWLAARADDPRPWFAMLHTNVVHDYDEEQPWTVDVERFLGRPLHPALRRFRDGPHLWQTPPEGLDHATLREELLAKYRGCVAETDRRLAAALASVDLAQTVVVIASDHGEGFEASRARVHHCGRAHDDLLRVPLLLHLPPGTDGAAPGTTVDHPCSLIDVAPTLLRLAGADAGDLPGADLRELPPGREIRAEDYGYLYLPPGDVGQPLRRYDYKTHDVATTTVVRWPAKSVHARIGRQEWHEEYDLDLDPLERVNRAAGAQGPVRRPRKGEGSARAAWRTLRADSAESRYLAFANGYARFAKRVAGRRRLPPVERHRPFAEIDEREPITFVVAVADPSELRWHVLASECFKHGGHQWLFVENGGNRAYSSISRLYADAARRARHDLRFYVHQDVYFPPDWEDRLFRALAHLEAQDDEWGVIGAAGRAHPDASGGEPPNVGHWSDPHKYHRPRVGLPARVQVLDELWLGVRASRGLEFDPDVPGFHCYGADLCMTARSRGLESYVIDAPVVHKLFLPDGTLIERSEESHKIEDRRTEAFRADFERTARHVATKWHAYLPFQSTCHRYEVDDADPS